MIYVVEFYFDDYENAPYTTIEEYGTLEEAITAKREYEDKSKDTIRVAKIATIREQGAEIIIE